jgi:6-phosphogluconolactonase
MGRPLRLRHRPICWLTRNSGSSKQSARPIPARGIRGARIAVHGEHPRSAAVSLVPHPRFATPAGGQLRQWQHRGLALGADGVPQEVTSVFDSYGAGPPPAAGRTARASHSAWPRRHVLGVDLGADVVRRLQIRPNGVLAEGEPVVVLPAGTGPRQIRVSADQRTAYVLGELSGELITVALGPLRLGAIVNRRPAWLSDPSGPNLPARLLAVGDRLYVSRRGLDRITVFGLKNDVPTPLTEIETGTWPRHFALSGRWLYTADQLDDQMTVHDLRSSRDSGQISLHIPIWRPTCVLLVALGSGRPP